MARNARPSFSCAYGRHHECLDDRCSCGCHDDDYAAEAEEAALASEAADMAEAEERARAEQEQDAAAQAEWEASQGPDGW